MNLDDTLIPFYFLLAVVVGLTVCVNDLCRLLSYHAKCKHCKNKKWLPPG